MLESVHLVGSSKHRLSHVDTYHVVGKAHLYKYGPTVPFLSHCQYMLHKSMQSPPFGYPTRQNSVRSHDSFMFYKQTNALCLCVDSHCHPVGRMLKHTSRGKVITMTRRASGDCSHDRQSLGSMNSAQVLVHLRIRQSGNEVQMDQFGGWVGGVSMGECLNLNLRFQGALCQGSANPGQRVV